MIIILKSIKNSFPGSQPVSFESKHLLDIEREDYFVCEKSDGVRYLLFFLHSSKGPASFLVSIFVCYLVIYTNSVTYTDGNSMTETNIGIMYQIYYSLLEANQMNI